MSSESSALSTLDVLANNLALVGIRLIGGITPLISCIKVPGVLVLGPLSFSQACYLTVLWSFVLFVHAYLSEWSCVHCDRVVEIEVSLFKYGDGVTCPHSWFSWKVTFWWWTLVTAAFLRRYASFQRWWAWFTAATTVWGHSFCNHHLPLLHLYIYGMHLDTLIVRCLLFLSALISGNYTKNVTLCAMSFREA